MAHTDPEPRTPAQADPAGTIVAAVTGAPVCDRVVDWAIARAVERRQMIELISIVGGVVGAVGEADILAAAMQAASATLDRHAERVTAAGVAVRTRVDSGNPVTMLTEASTHAALLVIGSDYRGPGAGPSRGAHGIRIAAGSACPVVVVPDTDMGQRRGVVVGVDGSEVSEQALRFAAAEADRLAEPLTVVSVWTPVHAPHGGLAVYPDLYLTNMQAATEEIQALAVAGLSTDYPGLEIIRRVEQGYPSHVINEAASSARLAVVGTHGRGAIARFLLGSVSHEVLSRLATVTAVVR